MDILGDVYGVRGIDRYRVILRNDQSISLNNGLVYDFWFFIAGVKKGKKYYDEETID